MNQGGFLFSDANKKPRASVEHIYNGSDPKQLQLQQDRRLAQIHRQSTQEQQKLVTGERNQTMKTSYPHTQSQQYSAQQLHQPNASPGMMQNPN